MDGGITGPLDCLPALFLRRVKAESSLCSGDLILKMSDLSLSPPPSLLVSSWSLFGRLQSGGSRWCCRWGGDRILPFAERMLLKMEAALGL